MKILQIMNDSTDRTENVSNVKNTIEAETTKSIQYNSKSNIKNLQFE